MVIKEKTQRATYAGEKRKVKQTGGVSSLLALWGTRKSKNLRSRVGASLESPDCKRPHSSSAARRKVRWLVFAGGSQGKKEISAVGLPCPGRRNALSIMVQ